MQPFVQDDLTTLDVWEKVTLWSNHVRNPLPTLCHSYVPFKISARNRRPIRQRCRPRRATRRAQWSHLWPKRPPFVSDVLPARTTVTALGGRQSKGSRSRRPRRVRLVAQCMVPSRPFCANLGRAQTSAPFVREPPRRGIRVRHCMHGSSRRLCPWEPPSIFAALGCVHGFRSLFSSSPSRSLP